MYSSIQRPLNFIGVNIISYDNHKSQFEENQFAFVKKLRWLHKLYNVKYDLYSVAPTELYDLYILEIQAILGQLSCFISIIKQANEEKDLCILLSDLVQLEFIYVELLSLLNSNQTEDVTVQVADLSKDEAFQQVVVREVPNNQSVTNTLVENHDNKAGQSIQNGKDTEIDLISFEEDADIGLNCSILDQDIPNQEYECLLPEVISSTEMVESVPATDTVDVNKENTVDVKAVNTVEFDIEFISIDSFGVGVFAEEHAFACDKTILICQNNNDSAAGYADSISDYTVDINTYVNFNGIAGKFWKRRQLILDYTTPLGRMGLKNYCFFLLMIGYSKLMIIVNGSELLFKHHCKPYKIDNDLSGMRTIEYNKTGVHELVSYLSQDNVASRKHSTIVEDLVIFDTWNKP